MAGKQVGLYKNGWHGRNSNSTTPPHPFTAGGRREFDALLQSKPGVFPGRLLICDATTWSSTAVGIADLQRFWRNIALLKRAAG